MDVLLCWLAADPSAEFLSQSSSRSMVQLVTVLPEPQLEEPLFRRADRMYLERAKIFFSPDPLTLSRMNTDLLWLTSTWLTLRAAGVCAEVRSRENRRRRRKGGHIILAG